MNKVLLLLGVLVVLVLVVLVLVVLVVVVVVVVVVVGQPPSSDNAGIITYPAPQDLLISTCSIPWENEVNYIQT